MHANKVLSKRKDPKIFDLVKKKRKAVDKLIKGTKIRMRRENKRRLLEF